MIRQSLPRSRRATYAVFAHRRGNSVAVRSGSGFFVSADGLLVTCEHVIRDTSQLIVSREPLDNTRTTFLQGERVYVDAEADFALLRVTLEDGERAPEFLVPDDRELDEGEPVYSVGYPLAVVQVPYVFDLDQVMEALPPEIAEQYRLPSGNLPTFGAMMAHRLSPRVTSAIISSRLEYYNMLDLELQNESDQYYIIDKALNYGNSGGPIVATETGHVHALISKFHPVIVPQSRGDAVVIPSLYGVATRLTFPPIRKALEDNGVSFCPREP
jgi:S1-C subfamily serine protease